mgnify:CR=1 FL=1
MPIISWTNISLSSLLHSAEDFIELFLEESLKYQLPYLDFRTRRTENFNKWYRVNQHQITGGINHIWRWIYCPNTSHQVLLTLFRHLWQFLHSLDHEQKKNFLTFVTGTDRVPIDGLKSLKFLIQRHSNTSNLPTAHTCFNVFLLP